MKALRLFLILMITALIIVACGGGDDNDSDTTEDDNGNETVANEVNAIEPITTLGLGQALSMALSPDDSHVAIGTSVGTIYVYDTADLSADPLAINLGNGRLADLAYSPDGTQIAVANFSGSIHVVDSTTGDIIWEGFPQRTTDGNLLLNLFEAALIPASIAYSPDGTTIAVGYDDSGNVTLFDAGTGENGRLLDGRTPITNIPQVMFTPDSTQLVASHGNKDIDVFDVATGELVVRREDELTAYALAVSPDGTTIATSNTQSGPRFITLLNLSDLTTNVELADDATGRALIYSPDGDFIIVARNNNQFDIVQVFDTANLTPLAQFPTRLPVNNLAISSDGSTLYITDLSALYVVDATALLSGDAETVITETLGTVTFSNWASGVDLTDDLSQGIVCLKGGTASIYNLATGEVTQVIDLPETHTCEVRYTPDESAFIAQVGLDGYGINIESGEVLFQYRVSGGEGISAEGNSALGNSRTVLNMYNFSDAPADGGDVEPAFSLDVAELGLERNTAMALSDDGSRGITLTVVTSTYPAVIFDTTTGEVVTQTPAWDEVIRAFAISGDGNTVVLVGYEDLGFDGNRIIANVYDVSGAEASLIAEIAVSAPENEHLLVRSVAIDDDGSLIALQTDDGIMHLWDRDAGAIVTSFASGLTYDALRFMPNSGYLIGYDGDTILEIRHNGVATIWDVSEYAGEMMETTEAPEAEVTAEATAESE